MFMEILPPDHQDVGEIVDSLYEWMCKVLAFTKEEKRELKFELEQTALHCSHAIVVARYSAEWPPRLLLDVSDWQGSFACGDNKHEQQVTAG